MLSWRWTEEVTEDNEPDISLSCLMSTCTICSLLMNMPCLHVGRSVRRCIVRHGIWFPHNCSTIAVIAAKGIAQGLITGLLQRLMILLSAPNVFPRAHPTEHKAADGLCLLLNVVIIRFEHAFALYGRQVGERKADA